MPESLNFTLSPAGLEIIATAINNDKRPEVRQRVMGLRWLHEGHRPQGGAHLMSVSPPTVYDWHHRWHANGLDGLAHRAQEDSDAGRATMATHLWC